MQICSLEKKIHHSEQIVLIAVPGGDLPPELEIDFMSESVEEISKKVMSNDFSSLLGGSAHEAAPSPIPNPDEVPTADSSLERSDDSFEKSKALKRKKKSKLQSKTEIDRDTCRKWVRLLSIVSSTILRLFC